MNESAKESGLAQHIIIGTLIWASPQHNLPQMTAGCFGHVGLHQLHTKLRMCSVNSSISNIVQWWWAAMTSSYKHVVFFCWWSLDWHTRRAFFNCNGTSVLLASFKNPLSIHCWDVAINLNTSTSPQGLQRSAAHVQHRQNTSKETGYQNKMAVGCRNKDPPPTHTRGNFCKTLAQVTVTEEFEITKALVDEMAYCLSAREWWHQDELQSSLRQQPAGKDKIV